MRRNEDRDQIVLGAHPDEVRPAVRAAVIEDDERWTMRIPSFPASSQVWEKCIATPVAEDVDVDKRALS
jgi:hypothetical protein